MRLKNFAALGAVMLSACAWTPEVRGLADKTGVFVSSLDSGTNEFVESQNRLNAQNAARLDNLMARSSMERASVRQQRLAWTDSGDTVRLSAHDAATAVTFEQIVAGLETNATAAPKVSSGTAEAYGKSRKALAEIVAGPKPGVQLQELLNMGQAVHEQFNELAEKAKVDGETTAAVGTQTDKTSNEAAETVKQGD